MGGRHFASGDSKLSTIRPTQVYERLVGIALDEPFDNYNNEEGRSLTGLKSLSRLNLFVGPNNAGKSRLLRHIVGVDDLSLEYSTPSVSAVRQLFTRWNEAVKAVPWASGQQIHPGVRPTGGDRLGATHRC